MKSVSGTRSAYVRADARRLGSAFQSRAWAAVLSIAAIGASSASYAAQPVRVVSGNTLISQSDPAVKITLPDSAHYVGSDRFVLSDPTLGKFDDCNLFAFVDSDAAKHIGKFYWIQFEAYLPSRPQLHHTYDSPRHATIGGLDFYVDTSVSPSNKQPEPGSDEAHFYSLLASHGYRRSDFMYVRLVHLTDATKRKELMIIYAENVAATGHTAAQLEKGGSEYSRWAAIANGLIRRAERNVAITAGGDSTR